MKYLKFFLLFALLVSFVIFAHTRLKDNFDSEIRLVNDFDGDLKVYYSRGLWYPLKEVPYLESFSEYPQVATYLFAAPHAALSSLYKIPYSRERYYLAFSILMITFLTLSFILLCHLRPDNVKLALLMLLPASLYFSYNRYDILPAFLSILSIWLLSKERYKSSAFFLALGVLTKWYLILLFPIFLKTYHSRHKKINFGMIYVFCLTGIAVALPTLLSGGIGGFLIPYRFHMARGLNKESLFYLVKSLLGSDAWFAVFFVLQFSVLPFVMISKIDSLRKVVNWSALSILVFMLFAKFYSPQWILWAMPFLIMRAKKRQDVLLIIIFDLVTYLYFPVIYDGYPNFLYPIVVIKTIIILYLITTIINELGFLHRNRVHVKG
jgi:hypothetical protein